MWIVDPCLSHIHSSPDFEEKYRCSEKERRYGGVSKEIGFSDMDKGRNWLKLAEFIEKVVNFSIHVAWIRPHACMINYRIITYRYMFSMIKFNTTFKIFKEIKLSDFQSEKWSQSFVLEHFLFVVQYF